MTDIETHPLPPFLPPDAKVLMPDSFPPPRARWKMDFYYPNFQNDMWRIFGLIWFGDKNHFIDLQLKSFKEAAIRAFLQETGIAVYDTAVQVRRLQNNAADKYLQIVQAVDLQSLLAEMPDCAHILTTGDLATQTLYRCCRSILLRRKSDNPCKRNAAAADCICTACLPDRVLIRWHWKRKRRHTVRCLRRFSGCRKADSVHDA
ncbi:putative DNA glycosylase [Neisseria animalis]|nr:putative DNA glycosylase [Neisseria animalis]